jgi:hypothetical protein
MITRDAINKALNDAKTFNQSVTPEAPVTQTTLPTPVPQPGPVSSKPISSPTQTPASTSVTPTTSPAIPVNEDLSIGASANKLLPDNSLQAIGQGLGLDFPSTAELKTMDWKQKSGAVGAQLATFPVKMVLGLPKAVVQMLPNFVIQGAKPIEAWMSGRPMDFQSLSEMPNDKLTDLPLVNALPVNVKDWIDKNIQPQGDYFGTAEQSGKETENISKLAGLPAPLAKFIGNVWKVGSIASQAFADIAVTATMADTMKNALTPRTKLVEGSVANVEPIKNAIATEGKIFKAPETESPSQYYSLSKDFATSKWGGTEKNTFWKVAPSTDGSVEMSVVRMVKDKPGEMINVNGVPVKVVQGKFGNEIRLQSEILKKPIAPVGGEITPAETVSKPRTIKDIVNEQFGEDMVQLETLRESVNNNPLKALEKYVAKSGKSKGELPQVSGNATKGLFATKGDTIAQDAIGYKATDAQTPYLEDVRVQFEGWQKQKAQLTQMEKDLKTKISNTKFELKDQSAINEFLGKEGGLTMDEMNNVSKPKPVGREAGITPPVRGMENKLVSQAEIDSIDRISRVAGVDSRITNSLIKNITGKKIAADLTRGEAYDVMKQLSSFASPYIKKIPTTFFDRWLSSPRHWTARYQEKTGIPIGDSWQRLEESEMLSKVKIANAEGMIKDIWGDYLKNPDARTAVRAYRLGDEASILDNSIFNSAQKTDLISIASKVDDFYKTLGPDVNVPMEVFLNGPYSPEIQALGGKFTLYKTKGKIPAPSEITITNGEKVPGSSFFAKQKRHGSIGDVLNDEAELMDIYARAGYKHKYFDPAVTDAKNLLEVLPDQGLKDHWASMVQEKMGYGGAVERFMNDTVPKYFEKIPFIGDKLNMPADFARQFMNYSLGWVSANVMSQPATWFRDFLSYPTLGYAQMGSKFMGSSMADFMIPGKRSAMWKNAQDRGFILQRGLSSEIDFRGSSETLGGKTGKVYTNLVEKVVAPKSWSDNVTRVLLVDQSEKIFNDALARYNKNPTAAMWKKFETDSGLDGFSLTDRNGIRQSLLNGDVNGALNRFIQTNIDNSVWPYRQGSSGRAFYGAGGKMGGFLMKWPFEYVSTIGDWARSGQWNKIVRLYGSVHAINETFKKELGWDFSTSFLMGPILGLGLSPLPKMAWNFLNAGMDALKGDMTALDNDKDAVMQTFQSSIRPGGVMRKNAESLIQSYTAYKNGIVGPGDTLPVYNTNGQVLYYDKFSNLFWRLWGFPTNTMVEHSQLRGKERTQSSLQNIQSADIRSNMLQLLRTGDADKLNAYVSGLVANGIKPPQVDMSSLYIPLDYKLFQQMTPEAKSIFGPAIQKLYGQ